MTRVSFLEKFTSGSLSDLSPTPPPTNEDVMEWSLYITTIWDTIDDWYINNLAKIEVYAVFFIRALFGRLLPKFMELCMETPCWNPSEGHQHCGHTITETSVIEFAIETKSDYSRVPTH